MDYSKRGFGPRTEVMYNVHSAAASGWAGWALTHPEFGISLNPIPTRGADYAHRITACPPGIENLAASLLSDCQMQSCVKM